MNLRAVLWLLGLTLLLLAGFMLVPLGISMLYGEHEVAYAFGESATISALCGVALAWFNRGSIIGEEGRANYFRREGLAAVGLTWFASGLMGALPYLISGEIASPVDALFESISGFTTTGSTILQGFQIDGLSRGMAFWRSFTHWLGGIGIVLVFVVLFPTGGRSLFRSEVPGIAREAGLQRVRDSAISLVRIYVGLTVLEVILLATCGLDFYESTLHAFGTLATGGFSNHATSVAFFGSWRVELVLVVFMFAAGVNFGLYDNVLRLGARAAWRTALRSMEFRFYMICISCSTLFIAAVLWFWGGSNGVASSDLPNYSSLLLSLRDSLFAVVSVQTSTGFATADFDRWPEVCRMLLMFLALAGACAGSTGGGIKLVRTLILAKAALRGVQRFARPRAIHTVRMDDHTLDEGVVASVTGYFVLWVLVFLAGTLALSALDIEPLVATTAVIATLNNIGPGLEMVGPTGSFASMPDLAKLLLSLFMILGRLEFYAVVVLFVPRFWR